MAKRAAALINQPYDKGRVTMGFHKGTETVSFQATSMAVVGRLPAVGEDVSVEDARVTPVAKIYGPVKSVTIGYQADIALGIAIDFQVG